MFVSESSSSLTIGLPTPSEDQLRYIRSISDSHTLYKRYFSALLISSSSHAEFYADLRSFRELDDVLPLFLNSDIADSTYSLSANSTTTLTTSIASSQTLVPPNQVGQSQYQSAKTLNRRITSAFLASRFAHPWCNSTIPYSSNAGIPKPGWTKAIFGSSKNSGEARRKEEDKLHHLLVPIWIAFRAKMNPSVEELERWIQEDIKNSEERRIRGGSTLQPSLATKIQKPQPTKVSTPSTSRKINRRVNMFNAERYLTEDDEYFTTEDKTLGEREINEDASAAAKLMIGIAATGLFMSQNERTKKYIVKKLNQRR